MSTDLDAARARVQAWVDAIEPLAAQFEDDSMGRFCSDLRALVDALTITDEKVEAAWRVIEDRDARYISHDDMRAALEAAFGSKLTITDDAEYEWGVARTRFPSSPAYPQQDRESCERFIENPPLGTIYPKGPWLILRRRKAGSWEPLEAAFGSNP